MERKPKKLKILFIGRIEEDNGIRIYSETLSLLRNFHFEACGDGSKRPEFEKFGKVNGFVKYVEKYISKADIVFASSYLSIISAMKLRKPIFSVFENSLKEDYLKMTPFHNWIYISKTSDGLVKKIMKVIKNKNLREKNINLAYNWASGQTWEKVFKVYTRLWQI